jgi:hypothetical protein
LEAQIESFLDTLSIQQEIEEWLIGGLQDESERNEQDELARKRLLELSRDDTRAQLTELTGLRVRNLLPDEEFLARRRQLQQEEMRLSQKINEVDGGGDPFEPFRAVVSFRNQALDWFRHGDDEAKRLILETVGSNLTLTDKILNIQAAKPFSTVIDSARCPSQLAAVEAVRTRKMSRATKKVAQKFLDALRISLADEPRLDRIVENITKLEEIFRPEQAEDRMAA